MNGEGHESRLWDVLAAEHLVDLSQFHRARTFDEVPLFSRASEIDFLAGYARDRADAILLDFALKFFTAAVAYEEHRTPYFAAITAWSSPEKEWVIPNFFVWSNPIGPLQNKLALHQVTTPFGKRMRRLITKKKRPIGFDVLEDNSTDVAETRVFISFAQPPYKAFVTLDRFRKSAIRA